MPLSTLGAFRGFLSRFLALGLVSDCHAWCHVSHVSPNVITRTMEVQAASVAQQLSLASHRSALLKESADSLGVHGQHVPSWGNSSKDLGLAVF